MKRIDPRPSTLSIAANIVEPDSEYYQARLAAVPHVGDEIDFYPLEVDSPGDALRRAYVVDRVVHELYAVTKAYPEGHHFVTVHVRRL
jgi:hypothetical protein